MLFCKQSSVDVGSARCLPWKQRAGWTKPVFSEILTIGEGSRYVTSCVRARYGDSVRNPTVAGSSTDRMVLGASCLRLAEAALFPSGYLFSTVGGVDERPDALFLLTQWQRPERSASPMISANLDLTAAGRGGTRDGAHLPG